MKVNTVRYERLYNLGDYEHEKVCIEVELSEGESASDALTKVQKWCEVNSLHFDVLRENAGCRLKSFSTPPPEGETRSMFAQQEFDKAEKQLISLQELEDEVESFGLVG
ncbi:hypothetical protein M0R72_08000 [Candidatus Pacearchaeota archaeon]|jgi:hypothetical protein|nr:hypothetical protein [Candidatus Pacearchaeota archaeon]